ncbi:Sec20-domain-containing protein [Sistotremastrum suecicum HHB10207 ss-3]|uniref:Sec20-domain-containing protein n=1 Tax=Sistotremastrum suecicum HHB10207 ss-3 TaxID=1314776 RepID=A0A165ZYM1_9AGAM|nr:Sec20-domain-containing protein [Sistotremastrum suecicum HHB10207 ss-3]
MAPVPVTLSTTSSTLIASLTRLTADIQSFQLPRLSDCAGPLSIQQRYAAELRDDLEKVRVGIEKLDVGAEDEESAKARAEVRERARELEATLSELRKDFRAALLTSKKTIDSQSASNRAELLRAAQSNPQSERNGKSGDDILMATADNVTETMRRTVALMQTELERSVLSTQLLESSTATLQATSTQHTSLTSILLSSQSLIKSLERADWIDRLLILSSLAFFFLVVGWILKARILDRAVRVGFWWTRFLPSLSSLGLGLGGGEKEVLDMLERGRRLEGVVEEVKSVATTATGTGGTVDALVQSVTTALSLSIPTASTIASLLSSASPASASIDDSTLSSSAPASESSAFGEPGSTHSSASATLILATEYGDGSVSDSLIDEIFESIHESTPALSPSSSISSSNELPPPEHSTLQPQPQAHDEL